MRIFLVLCCLQTTLWGQFRSCDFNTCGEFLTNSINISTGVNNAGTVIEPELGAIDPNWQLINNPPLINCSNALQSTINGSAYVSTYNNFSGNAWVNQEGASPLSPVDMGTTGNFGCDNGFNAQNQRVPYVFERQFCLCSMDSVNINFTYKGDDELFFELIDLSNNLVLHTSAQYVYENPPPTPLVFNYSGKLMGGSYAIRAYLSNTVRTTLGFTALGAVTSLTDSRLLLGGGDCCQSNTIVVTKILDDNCNGELEQADIAAEGWTFNIFNAVGNLVSSGVTDENGNFIASGLPDGVYTIQEVNQTEWIPGTPAEGTLNVNITDTLNQFYFFNCKDTLECAVFELDEPVCNQDGTAKYTFSGTNTFTGGQTFDRIRVYNPFDNSLVYSENVNIPPGGTFGPISIDLPESAGQDSMCLRVYFYSDEAVCCHEDICFDIPCCVPPNDDCKDIVFTHSGIPGSLEYNFSVPDELPSGTWTTEEVGGITTTIMGTGNSISYTFPSGGSYVVCYTYTGEDGCTYECCITVCIEDPFVCDLLTVNDLGSQYELSLPGVAASDIIFWFDGSGTILGASSTQTVPKPLVGECITVSVVLYDLRTNCYEVCSKEICNCEVEDNNCEDLKINYIGAGSALSYFFSVPVTLPAGNWTVTDVSTGTVTPVSSGYIMSYDFPTGGTFVVCYEYIDEDGCLHKCCKTLCVEDPYACESIVATPIPGGNYELSVPGVNPTEIVQWVDDFSGDILGTEPTLVVDQFLADGCRYISVILFDLENDCYQVCAIKVCRGCGAASATSFSQNENGGYTVTMTVENFTTNPVTTIEVEILNPLGIGMDGCNNPIAIPVTGAGPYTIDFQLEDCGAPITPGMVIDYKVVLIDLNSPTDWCCHLDSLSFTIPDNIGLPVGEGIHRRSNYRLFPNPANLELFVDQMSLHQYGANQIEIYDSSGRLVLRQSLTNTNRVDISQLVTGVYMARIKKDNQAIRSEKFLKAEE